jgi:diguanylate cyclase (GGDEF)-like protein/PAS domain S-box-containing protein
MQFPGSIDDLQALLEVIPNPVIVKNRAHQIILVNSAACVFLGRSKEELITLSDYEMFPAEQVRGFHDSDDRVFSSGGIDEREEQVTDGQGAVRHVITRKQSATLNGSLYLVAVISDVTAYRESQAQNRNLVLYDVLTGLPNRIFSSQHFEQMHMTRPGQCAFLLTDLDHFGPINDMHGFPAGDELLIQFGQRLLSVVRVGDTVSRLGGDCFSVLLTEMNTDTSVEDVCERILKAAAQPFELSSARVQISASIGLALPQDGLVTPTETKRRAGVALSQAKADGRSRWCAYSDEFDRKYRHRQSTEADLREALVTGTGIEVHYQPLATISSGEVIGFEALARWHHPTRGMVMPDDFIPVAEASGLIVLLGERVLRQACQDAAGWDPPLRLSVNVSPLQFVQGDLVSTIAAALKDSGLDPKLLELEITEGVLIDDANGTLALLNRIRALGVTIVLDDFGTGFSSLSYLRHFPFSKVKIDKSFIADMMEDDDVASIVKAVLLLSKSLNIEVVAEGVETKDQLDLLRELGCAQAQGYLISRPLPINNLRGTFLNADVHVIEGHPRRRGQI